MPIIIATKPHRYAGRAIKVGEHYSASRRDAQVLVTIKHAKYAKALTPQQQTPPAPLPAALEPTVSDVVPTAAPTPVAEIAEAPPVPPEQDPTEPEPVSPPKRRYRRRDLQAEDTSTIPEA